MPPVEEKAVPKSHGTSLLLLALVLSFALAWMQWSAYASAFDAFATSSTQLAAMQDDARRIAAFQSAPQLAVGQTRTHQELLHQVEKALHKASIDRNLWSDSVPQSAVRLPDTNYQRAGVRLFLERVSLQQVAAFAYHLTTDDQTLNVSALSIVNRDQQSADFDVDISLSYLVFSPFSD